eukprot:9477264-Pyramimonas_sp.AAC.2
MKDNGRRKAEEVGGGGEGMMMRERREGGGKLIRALLASTCACTRPGIEHEHPNQGFALKFVSQGSCHDGLDGAPPPVVAKVISSVAMGCVIIIINCRAHGLRKQWSCVGRA